MSKLFQRCVFILAAVTVGLTSCTKTDEPTHPVGGKIPYTGGATRTIGQILDSLPNCTFYDSAYRHAGFGAYLDSLRAGVSSNPFTLFVPTDDAFKAAGYTLQSIGQTAPAVLDSLLFYLTTSGYYSYINLDSLTGNVTMNTLLTDPAMQRTLINPGFSAFNPYQYMLYAGLRNGTLWLNGIPCKTAAQALQATNGVVWPVDKLIQKPTLETYQVLKADTTYTLYMAALRCSDSVYQNVNFSLGYYFKDTVSLQLKQGLGYVTVLAPTNDAFRKAGFNSINDIANYINHSACVLNGGVGPNGVLIRTNMDSVLDLHRVGYAPSFYYAGGLGFTFNVTTILYTNDLLYNPQASNLLLITGYLGNSNLPPVYTGVNFQNANGQAVVHRVDAPGGRAASVISPHDITTLNGVIHRVDNLLLPNP